MKTNAYVNKYIVQKGDTIESICEKFDISKRLFYRYNKIMKYIPLTPNTPIHIVSLTKLEIIDMNLEIDTITTSLTSIAYLIKECIVSSLYFKDNVHYNKEALKEEHQKLVNGLSLSNDQKDTMRKDIEAINFKIIEISDVLLTKDKEKLKTYEKEIKENIQRFIEDISTIYFETNKEVLYETIENISRDYQTLALRLILKKYDEVYKLFKKILENYELINKSLLLH